MILDFYSRPCGRGDKDHGRLPPGSAGDFYSRPCGRGDQTASVAKLGYQPISTHAPAGGATTLLCVLAHPATISTHAPAGGATNCAPTKEVQEFVISTHAPAGGATISMTKESAAFAISTHAPAGGATGFLFAFITGGEDFYSRPCGRGDPAALLSVSARGSSTHAPAGGATAARSSARRSTCPFLLTPLREGRLELLIGSKYLTTISTHAPAGGATPTPCSTARSWTTFLLTPLREGRHPICTTFHRKYCYFYSRPCGRGDAPCRASPIPSGDFYSRPCGRGDSAAGIPAAFRRIISTHAPAGGATGRAEDYRGAQDAFLLTPLREGRPIGPQRAILNCISTHAPAGGATWPHEAYVFEQKKFLLTPLREGRPRSALICQPAQRISTHAPAGGATDTLNAVSVRECISTHAPAGGATR